MGRYKAFFQLNYLILFHLWTREEQYCKSQNQHPLLCTLLQMTKGNRLGKQNKTKETQSTRVSAFKENYLIQD